MNEIPFAALQPHSQQQQQQSVSEVPAEDAAATSIWGSGFTSEGIDQNPVYYEFMLEANWRTERVARRARSMVWIVSCGSSGFSRRLKTSERPI